MPPSLATAALENQNSAEEKTLHGADDGHFNKKFAVRRNVFLKTGNAGSIFPFIEKCSPRKHKKLCTNGGKCVKIKENKRVKTGNARRTQRTHV